MHYRAFINTDDSPSIIGREDETLEFIDSYPDIETAIETLSDSYRYCDSRVIIVIKEYRKTNFREFFVGIAAVGMFSMRVLYWFRNDVNGVFKLSVLHRLESPIDILEGAVSGMNQSLEKMEPEGITADEIQQRIREIGQIQYGLKILKTFDFNMN